MADHTGDQLTRQVYSPITYQLFYVSNKCDSDVMLCDKVQIKKPSRLHQRETFFIQIQSPLHLLQRKSDERGVKQTPRCQDRARQLRTRASTNILLYLVFIKSDVGSGGDLKIVGSNRGHGIALMIFSIRKMFVRIYVLKTTEEVIVRKPVSI